MPAFDRDEYAETHSTGPGFLLWVIWVAATMLGLHIGAAVGDFMANNLTVGGEQDIAPAAVRGLVGGLALGFAQGVVLLTYMKLRGMGQWILATILGRCLRAIVVVIIANALSGLLFADNVIGSCGFLLATGAVGAFTGAIPGAFQWFVLRKRVQHPVRWIVASAASSTIYITIVALAQLTQFYPLTTGNTLLSYIIIGVITATLIVDLLRHPTTLAEWEIRLKPEKPISTKFDAGTQTSPEVLLEQMRVEDRKER